MSRSLTTAGVEVRSSSRTSTSTRNPRPTPGHPHSTRKSRKTSTPTRPRHAQPRPQHLHPQMRRAVFRSTIILNSRASCRVLQWCSRVSASLARPSPAGEAKQEVELHQTNFLLSWSSKPLRTFERRSSQLLFSSNLFHARTGLSLIDSSRRLCLNEIYALCGFNSAEVSCPS